MMTASMRTMVEMVTSEPVRRDERGDDGSEAPELVRRCLLWPRRDNLVDERAA